jgi:hypothetical protein
MGEPALEYPIFDISDEAPGLATSEEALGTKPKFWFRRSDDTEWLFKFARPNTGEDWAERIATEIAAKIGLPHAVVELAEYHNKRGIITKNFAEEGVSLIHGNQLLFEASSDYPIETFRNVRQHTVEAILGVLSDIAIPMSAPAGMDDAGDMFLGYLLLDALIGNTDRHHENWGILSHFAEVGDAIYVLAPTYDHASSLGRELSNDARERKYMRRNHGYDVDKYLNKCRSAIFADVNDEVPLSPIGAFERLARLRPAAAAAWLDRLGDLECSELNESIGRVPCAIMSECAKSFARTLLARTRLLLLETGHD